MILYTSETNTDTHTHISSPLGIEKDNISKRSGLDLLLCVCLVCVCMCVCTGEVGHLLYSGALKHTDISHHTLSVCRLCVPVHLRAWILAYWKAPKKKKAHTGHKLIGFLFVDLTICVFIHPSSNLCLFSSTTLLSSDFFF